MKKRVVCLIGLTVVLVLGGCGKTAQTPVDAQSETQEAAGEDADSEEEYDYSEYIVEDTDITMEELRAVNSPLALMKEHQSLGFTWENYDADHNLQSTTRSQFIFHEGKLWFDSELTDAEGNKTYYSDYEADDQPGASFFYQENSNGGSRGLTLYPSSEYQYWVSQQWMPTAATSRTR